MLYLNVKGMLDNEQTKAMIEFWGGVQEIFTVESLNKFLTDNPDDNELMLNIDCDGGSVEEGLKIYDALRMSGKTLYTNISGGCHSMAIVILLAAPAENRSGNRNLRALIHRVYTGMAGIVSADDCLDLADNLIMEEDAILDIYEDRTGMDRNQLREVMRSEKIHDADSLIKLNFISKINSYNTNQFFNFMSNKLKSAYDAFIERRNAYRKRNEIGKTQNAVYEYKDAEGNVVFTSEVAPEEFAVGAAVTLMDGEISGTFILEDGKEVVVTDGIVESIDEKEEQSEEERIEELEIIVEEASNLIDEQQKEIVNLRNELLKFEGSNYTPKVNRHTHVPAKKDPKADNRSTEDIKAQAKATRDLANNKVQIVKSK